MEHRRARLLYIDPYLGRFHYGELCYFLGRVRAKSEAAALQGNYFVKVHSPVHLFGKRIYFSELGLPVALSMAVIVPSGYSVGTGGSCCRGLITNPAKWRIILPLLLLGIGSTIFVLFVYLRNWKRDYQDSAFCEGPVSFTATLELVEFRFQGGRWASRWSDLQEAVEHRGVFVFWKKRGPIYFVPKSGFSATQAADLREMIASRHASRLRTR